MPTTAQKMLLLYDLAGGGGAAAPLTGGALLLEDEDAGLGIDFTTLDGLGSVAVKGHTTNLDNVPAADFLTNAGTSTKWAFNASGILVEKPAETPVIDFGPGGNDPHLLSEPAVTNVILRSNELDNAAWNKSNLTISADAITAPDGATTADKLEEAATTSEHYANTTAGFALTADVANTVTVYFKAAERTWVQMSIGGAGGGPFEAWFDIGTGAVGTQTNCTGTITELINGWYRCSMTFTPTTTSGQLYIKTSTGNGVTSYLGVLGSGLYAWGGQAELGLVTSPIPTAGSTVTRAADANNAALSTIPFSATVGTVYLKGRTPKAAAAAVLFSLDDGTADERLRITYTGTNINVVVTDGGVAVATLDLGAVAVDTDFQITFGWEEDNFAASLDGGAVVTDVGGALPTVTTMRLGYSPAGERGVTTFGKLAYTARRVSNGDLPTWRYAA